MNLRWVIKETRVLITKIIRYYLNILYNIWIELKVVNLIVKDESDGKQSIDPGDWVSGIIEFIRTFFLNRGIILSEKAYVSLFLGIWTVFLIWLASKNYSELYILPIGFFIYFFLHLLGNWSWAQNMFKRMLNRPEYDIKLIKEDRKSYAEIAKIIKRHATNKPKEVIEIINEFIKNGKFKEDIQTALFDKYDTYSPTLIQYIDDILLSNDFSPNALIKYLYISPINEDYLRKLVEKYKKSNSFLFNLGRFQFYKFEDGSIEKKYYKTGYNFERFKNKIDKAGNFTMNFFGVLFIVIIIWGLTLELRFIDLLVVVSIGFIIFVLIINSINAISVWIEKKKVKALLAKEKIELEESELEKFLIELDL